MLHAHTSTHIFVAAPSQNVDFYFDLRCYSMKLGQQPLKSESGISQSGNCDALFTPLLSVLVKLMEEQVWEMWLRSTHAFTHSYTHTQQSVKLLTFELLRHKYWFDHNISVYLSETHIGKSFLAQTFFLLFFSPQSLLSTAVNRRLDAGQLHTTATFISETRRTLLTLLISPN